MSRRLVLTTFVLILILSFFCLPLIGLQVRANGLIVINIDGSIDPPTVPIFTTDNITYTFTDNINSSIWVLRSNIIIDGNGYTLQPLTSPSDEGILLHSVNNVTIRHVNIQSPGTAGVRFYETLDCTLSGNFINASSGIILDGSSNNAVFDNNITAKYHHGIFLYQSQNNKIYRNNITAVNITGNRRDFMRVGIFFWFSSNNSLNMNNITHNERGIDLKDSSNNVLRNNMIADNDYNFLVEDVLVNDVDASNTVDGKPIYYLINKQNLTIPSDAGFIALINCTKIVVQGLNLTNNMPGILLGLTTNSTLTMNNVVNNDYGVQLFKSSNNIISRNNITQNGANIYFRNSSCNQILQNTLSYGDGNHGSIDCWHSDNNTISENIIRNNHRGIDLTESSNNVITENNVTNNTEGIVIIDSRNNFILENSITRNRVTGIRLGNSSNSIVCGNFVTANSMSGILLSEWSEHNTILGNNIKNNSIGVWIDISSNNKIWHNNFIENSKHADYFFYGVTNFWDNGLEGNYWSNHCKVDSNHDGIGDSPYIIDQRNQDNYPLMGMFSSFNNTKGKNVNVVSNSTIESFQFFESNSSIKMYVSNITLNQTFGFCRVCIPKDLMSPLYYVIIDDGSTEVFHMNDALYDNGTHRWIYFAYEHSIREVNIIPEFPTILISSPFMMATFLAVLVYKRKHTS